MKPSLVGTRFHQFAMDTIGPTTLTKETIFKYILVKTYLVTKYWWPSTSRIDKRPPLWPREWNILQHLFLPLGLPDSLHTDQGTSFCSQFVMNVCGLLCVDKTRMLAFQAQSKGQVERHIKVVVTMLSKDCAHNPRVWDRTLPYITFIYNTAVYRTTRATPFRLKFGAECQYPIDLFYPQQSRSEPLEKRFVEELTQVVREEHH